MFQSKVGCSKAYCLTAYLHFIKQIEQTQNNMSEKIILNSEKTIELKLKCLELSKNESVGIMGENLVKSANILFNFLINDSKETNIKES